MHDTIKNVTSLFDTVQVQKARYEYASFGGLLTAEWDMAQENTLRFSCEFTDDELGLVYYNYCHFNPLTAGGSPVILFRQILIFYEW
ncbi:hypothetical protein [Akkermansia muciniphila]|uniref:hypothetical protein n=1 Tax=Akkermansia muciniphila TaxID=239935 RepID=UPI001BFF06EE|nr:hypothetical protein [Akkermansia muciniphila]MBT8778208.1 hypothetical protein [Akkermansia muciniphila]